VVWSNDDVTNLKMIGNAIANLLERKRVEDSLREVSRKLRHAQDEEQRRIARALHDSTAQQLAALMMNLGILEDSLSNSNEKAGKLLQESLHIVENCSQEIRTIAYLLHPPLLDQMGLEAALRSYIDGFSKRSGICVAVDMVAIASRLPPEIELTLFRVVQEALGNIHRHSGSKSASVWLEGQSDRVILEIRDEGKGMSAETLGALRDGVAPQGVGLAAMHERLREVQGRLEVESDASGTLLRAVILLRKDAS
jgi:signal transduction histidine kinase